MYKGFALKKFLVDRVALGLSDEYIRAEFEQAMGSSISQKEIDDILLDSEDEIKKRESELSDELGTGAFIANLSKIRMDLERVKEMALEEKDFRAYAQIVNSIMHSVELLIKVNETFRNKLQANKVALIQNNFFVLETLEKDGIIHISDKSKLEKLWGVKSNIIDVKPLPIEEASK